MERKEGGIQKEERQAMAPGHERVPEGNLDDLWAELQEAGLVTGLSGDASMVDVSTTGPWGQPAAMEGAQASLEPTITEEARAAANHTGVPAIVEEALASLAPAIAEALGERDALAFFQQELLHPADPPAIPLDHGSVSEADRDDFWENLPGSNPNDPKRRSPLSGDPIADLTWCTAPGFSNGGPAPTASGLGELEPAPTSPLPVVAMTEGAGVVEFGGMLVPSFIFGDTYETGQEVTSPIANTMDFTLHVQQRAGAPMCDVVPDSSCVWPSGNNGGEICFTGWGGESWDSESDSGIDEGERMYWAETMPKELRKQRGRCLRTSWIESL
ncbi:hypothetical protein C7212DRAFT_363413 [Tuber magnatum]|uniref:Uncharacterized protein n=1 Tax=Tuber magnatum TaxID=42249 RepID=A0A317SRV6_9PEZI|nr:hypothetical protein C7212DRAFT_363413 [Tuber magnatum]